MLRAEATILNEESSILIKTFDHIRPYRDEEVKNVIKRLCQDDELLNAIAGMRLSTLYKALPKVARFVVTLALKKELAGVSDVGSFQKVVKKYLDKIILKTTDGLSVKGLCADMDENPLYMSNHRDISLDPSLINYSLHLNNFETARIAIGDNLMNKPWISDFMRINKSFVVNRSAVGKKKLLAYKELSNYIQFSLKQEKVPVWIAQKEGRAKDSLDKTEPAIIRMLSMSMNKKETSFSAFINDLKIIPTVISYEWDPCDKLKAKELHSRATKGSYEKSKDEDSLSMGLGISGYKGKINVCFSKPLKGDFKTPEEVANKIDEQIWKNYNLYPSNFVAWKMLTDNLPPEQITLGEGPFVPGDHKETFAQMQERVKKIPREQKDYFLSIYSNPIVSKKKLFSNKS